MTIWNAACTAGWRTGFVNEFEIYIDTVAQFSVKGFTKGLIMLIKNLNSYLIYNMEYS